MRRNQRASRPGALSLAGVLTVLGLALVSVGAVRAADEPRGLGRLFRFGGRTEPATSTAKPPAEREPQAPPRDPSRYAEPFDVGAPPSNVVRPYRGPAEPGTNPAAAGLSPEAGFQPLPSANLGPGAASLPAAPAAANGGRLVPQPRQARAVTQAPPLLTRVSLGRSDDGHQFGMFLQIFADGTVIDTEGVHKVGADVLRPLVEAMRAAELGRSRPFCGAPATDFVEQVHLVAYDQQRGRLTAHALSYSGNMQGCDPALQKLQEAIDAVQARLSPTPTAPAAPVAVGNPGLGLAAPVAAGSVSDAAPLPPPTLPAPTTPGAPALGLTPIE